ncbi:hypothetical protein TEA_014967 [Camellia sinensis var. sinensis]|uniref:RRM domain-containing protein n=1 Tax=Camellia sinensis var. sinensis TaxID=542762 RepID=A0A4S4DNY9_CAMSN|nr:hypothetical protein TEA_014967 [Camellia sinensis var. sinensis]
MAHQQPYDPYYLHQAPEYRFNNDRNGINTLFVSGLPDDVKTREIHNLFRRRSGFDSCQLKYTGRGTQVRTLAGSVDLGASMEHHEALASYCDLVLTQIETISMVQQGRGRRGSCDRVYATNLGEKSITNLSIGRSNDASPNQIHNERDELKQMSGRLVASQAAIEIFESFKEII